MWGEMLARIFSAHRNGFDIENTPRRLRQPFVKCGKMKIGTNHGTPNHCRRRTSAKNS